MKAVIKCECCGRDVPAERSTRRFCSHRCNKNFYSQSRRKRIRSIDTAAPHRCKKCGAKITTAVCIGCAMVQEYERRKMENQKWKAIIEIGQQSANQN
jgi:hypothetical protein